MPTLLCTAKYRRAFGLPERLPVESVEEGALGPWIAHTLNAGSQRLLHYMSEPALLSVVIHLRERQTAHQRLVSELSGLLRDLSVSEDYILREAALMTSMQLGRSGNLSKLASLRDQALTARHDLVERGAPIREVNLRLAQTPCGPLSYDSSGKVAPSLLAFAWKAYSGRAGA